MTLQIKKPELEAIIDKRLKNGRFQDVDELLMVAFDALDEKEHSTTSRPATTRRAMANWQAIRGIARGEGSLTEALIEERAAEKKHDEARLESHRFVGDGGMGIG